MNDIADERLASACKHFVDTVESLDENGRRKLVAATMARFAIVTISLRTPGTMQDIATKLATDRIAAEQRLDVTFKSLRDGAISMTDHDRIRDASTSSP